MIKWKISPKSWVGSFSCYFIKLKIKIKKNIAVVFLFAADHQHHHVVLNVTHYINLSFPLLSLILTTTWSPNCSTLTRLMSVFFLWVQKPFLFQMCFTNKLRLDWKKCFCDHHFEPCPSLSVKVSACPLLLIKERVLFWGQHSHWVISFSREMGCSAWGTTSLFKGIGPERFGIKWRPLYHAYVSVHFDCK